MESKTTDLTTSNMMEPMRPMRPKPNSMKITKNTILKGKPNSLKVPPAHVKHRFRTPRYCAERPTDNHGGG